MIREIPGYITSGRSPLSGATGGLAYKSSTLIVQLAHVHTSDVPAVSFKLLKGFLHVLTTSRHCRDAS